MRPGDADPKARFTGHRYVDEHRCLVHDDGTETALRPKTLAVFRHLAAHADRVVDRESLHDAVWDDAVVTDDSICKCVAEIRRAIGDTAHEVLRTVPRQGYLFVSDLPAVDAGRAEVPAPAAAPLTPPAGGATRDAPGSR